MKKVLFLIVMWAVCGGWASAQTALEVVWEKNAPLSDVFHVNFAPDGKSVYCASDYRIAQVNAENGETMWVSDSVGYVMDMEISPEGSYLVTCNYTPGVCVWDTKTNKQVYNFNPENSDKYGASFISVSPDGKYILMAYYKDENRYIAVYDYQNKTQIATIPCPFRITCLRYSHDGKTFAAGGYRTVGGFPDPVEKHDQVMLFDAENWKQIKLLEDSVGQGEGYFNIEYSYDDSRLGVARNSYGVRIYDIVSGIILSQKPISSYCANMTFLPDKNNMLYYFYDGGLSYDLSLYNSEEKKASYNICGAFITSNYANNSLRIVTGGDYKLTCIKPSPVGINEAVSTSATIVFLDKVIYLTHCNIERQELTVSIYNIEGKSVYEVLLDVSGSGKLRLNAELANGIYLYSIKTAKGVITDKFEVVN